MLLQQAIQQFWGTLRLGPLLDWTFDISLVPQGVGFDFQSWNFCDLEEVWEVKVFWGLGLGGSGQQELEV